MSAMTLYSPLLASVLTTTDAVDLRPRYIHSLIESAEVAIGAERLSGAAIELWAIIEDGAPGESRLTGLRWRVTGASGEVRVGSASEFLTAAGPEWWPADRYLTIDSDDGPRIEVAWSAGASRGGYTQEVPPCVG